MAGLFGPALRNMRCSWSAEMTYELHQGNALHILPTLEAGTVQTCVTSPPYWGLRDYGDPGQEWPRLAWHRLSGKR